jgi:formate hydrogenlyase subunit 3/multisubunit Na+/H+ antiporter MnhD subunit
MISAPLVLMAWPLLMAPLTYYARRWRWAESGMAVGAALLLVLLAAFLPLEFTVGPFAIVTNSFTILGRSFVVEAGDRPALVLISIQAALIFLGAALHPRGRYFYTAGLSALGVLTAALLVNPFLYAAIFLEIAAASAVFMLADERHTTTRGALRFLAYMTLGVPFILMVGWLLDASRLAQDNAPFIAQATLMMLAGFAVLLAIVPFHSWLAVVAEHAPPIATAFVFSVVQSGLVFLMLNALNTFDWLRESAFVRQAMLWAGLAMVAVGALFAFGQRNLGRSVGYALMIDIGAILLALSLDTAAGSEAAVAALALRGPALALWGTGLAQLRRASPDGTDTGEALRGLGWRYPLATAAVIFGVLALVGFPLTMGFPGRLALMQLLAQTNIAAALIVLMGIVSLGVVTVRTVAELTTRPEAEADLQIGEGPVNAIYYGVGLAGVLVIGAFPQWVLSLAAQAAQGLASAR